MARVLLLLHRGVTFNSLFEMQVELTLVGDVHHEYLSILYLRCRRYVAVV